MNQRIEAYNEHGSSFVDRLRTKIIFDSIRAKLPPNRMLDILDIGCGFHARFLIDLQDRIAHGTGIDVSVKKEYFEHPKLSFLLGDVHENLKKLPTNSFDVILFISVLEHLWNPQMAIDECFRVLKPGGQLMINVPTWWAKPVLELFAFKLGISPANEMDDHKMYYDKRDLWPKITSSGFKPSKVKMRYENFGMTLFVTAWKAPVSDVRSS